MKSIAPGNRRPSGHGPRSCPVRVAVALIWKRGRLLIQRRPDGVHLGGCWEFPGGKLRPEEAPDQAAVREVAEETGHAVRVVRALAVIRHRYPEKRVEIHPFVCRCRSGARRQNGPAGQGKPAPTAWRWVAPRRLFHYRFPPANRRLVAELAGGRHRLPRPARVDKKG